MLSLGMTKNRHYREIGRYRITVSNIVADLCKRCFYWRDKWRGRCGGADNRLSTEADRLNIGV